MMDSDGATTDVKLDSGTRLTGLLGDPVEHSLSPLIHNAAFQAQDLSVLYVAMRVSRARIEEAVRGLAALNFLGANVTVPHKEAVLSLMDELSPQAAAVGAVNTIVCRAESGTLYGDNTDVAGFLVPLVEMADRLHGTPMTVLGSGGAARAVAYALLTTFHPSRLSLAARTPPRAEALASDLASHDDGGVLEVVSLEDATDAVASSRLVVNTTPVGMYPDIDRSPWPATAWREDQVVYDVVYNPQPTRLLRDAAAAGAATIGGLDMLIAQAAASYAQWTGAEMPVDVVRAALHERF